MTYLDHYDRGSVATSGPCGRRGANLLTVCTHSWRDHTRLNLAQHYDPERVDAIMAGRDPKTQMDLARWANLGRRDAA